MTENTGNVAYQAYTLNNSDRLENIRGNHITIIGENLSMNNTLIINSTDIVEIINSTLDFTKLRDNDFLMCNYGTLIIENSTIISALNKSYATAIRSFGKLNIIDTSFINKQLLVNYETKICIIISAIFQSGGILNISNSHFENYTQAINIDRTLGSIVIGCVFIDCPYGIGLYRANNTLIKENIFMNSTAIGISIGETSNITIENNIMRNNRELLQNTGDLFGDVTNGIKGGGTNIYIYNNTIINTFKSIFILRSESVFIENNTITTTGTHEGEVQLEGVEYVVIRNNIITNQWDSIEIYNSRYILIEWNTIENGVTSIRIKRVDEYDGITPSNITIRHNLIVDSGLFLIERCLNVNITDNELYNAEISIVENSSNVIFRRNIINYKEFTIARSSYVNITNNLIKTSIMRRISIDWSQYITITNNTFWNTTFLIRYSSNVQITNNTIYIPTKVDVFVEVESENINTENNKIIVLGEEEGEEQVGEEQEEDEVPEAPRYEYTIYIAIIATILVILGLLLWKKQKS